MFSRPNFRLTTTADVQQTLFRRIYSKKNVLYILQDTGHKKSMAPCASELRGALSASRGVNLRHLIERFKQVYQDRWIVIELIIKQAFKQKQQNKDQKVALDVAA